MDIFLIPRADDYFQKPLSPAELEAICRRAFGPNAGLLSVREVPAGLFNSTFRIEVEGRPLCVLRVAPSPEAYVFYNERWLMRREYSILPYLGGVSWLVPKVLMADFTHQLLPRDYVFQECYEGKVWDEIKTVLTDEQNAALWRQLGEITCHIHAMTRPTLEGGFGYPLPMPSFPFWSQAVIDMVRGMQSDLIRLDLSEEGVDHFVENLEDGRGCLDEVREPHLLHGDIWPKNVLVRGDEGGFSIVGLLDSERAVWGDPQAEWAFHQLEIPLAFWEGYGGRYVTPCSEVRILAYKGIYAVQMFLEAWRFKFSDAPFRNMLAETVQQMETLLE